MKTLFEASDERESKLNDMDLSLGTAKIEPQVNQKKLLAQHLTCVNGSKWVCAYSTCNHFNYVFERAHRCFVLSADRFKSAQVA